MDENLAILASLRRVMRRAERNFFLGCFGSRAYGNPRSSTHPNGASDLDLLLVAPDKNTLTELMRVDPFELLFKEAGRVGVSHDLNFVLGKADIIQLESEISMQFIGVSTSSMQVDLYITTLDSLAEVCGVEPGGYLVQKYSTPPTIASVKPYNLMTTAGTHVAHTQRVSLSDNEALVTLMSDSEAESFVRRAISDGCMVFFKRTAGLPRINPATLEMGGEIDPILIGITGDKVLTLKIIYDPDECLTKRVVMPAWERVARDFRMRTGDAGNFASLFQRYNSGKFPAAYVTHINQLYEKAAEHSLTSLDFKA